MKRRARLSEMDLDVTVYKLNRNETVKEAYVHNGHWYLKHDGSGNYGAYDTLEEGHDPVVRGWRPLTHFLPEYPSVREII